MKARDFSTVVGAVTKWYMNNKNEVSDSELDKIISDTVSLAVEKLIKELKSQSKVLAIYKKKSEHWQIRELKTAITCGENLVKLRKMFGDRGVGFKQLIETEFANEFSYKTCLRYMKLYHGKNEIKSDIKNIRQAYIKLEIVTESYNYPAESTEVVEVGSKSDNNNSPPNTNDDSNTKKNSGDGILDKPTPSSSSILVAFKDPNKPEDSEKTMLEFMITQEGQMVQRLAGTTYPLQELRPKGHKWLLNHLKPYVEWYNKNIPENNVLQFSRPTPTELENIAA
jgi:hypothetical protein